MSPAKQLQFIPRKTYQEAIHKVVSLNSVGTAVPCFMQGYRRAGAVSRVKNRKQKHTKLDEHIRQVKQQRQTQLQAPPWRQWHLFLKRPTKCDHVEVIVSYMSINLAVG